MFNYGFANYVNKIVVDDRKPLNLTVSVLGGKKQELEVVAEKPVFIFSEKNKQQSVEITFTPIEKVLAPVSKGDVVGKLTVYKNNVEIASVNVISNEFIAEKTYFDVINDVVKDWGII
jgi:D-alanyl-D-alanine carboxypeptidase (penicillin-binding protein 5/6)